MVRGDGIAIATGVSRLLTSSRATPEITRPPTPFDAAGTVAVNASSAEARTGAVLSVVVMAERYDRLDHRPRFAISPMKSADSYAAAGPFGLMP
jgi:hypothetical protein